MLVIGDSISMNYHDAAKQALDGVANYHRIEGNSWATRRAVRRTPLWLGAWRQPGHHWDVIQFNSGLHDMKQATPDGPHNVPVEMYKANLRQQIDMLKEAGATLIFATTTPVQNDSGSDRYGYRSQGAEKKYNAAAREVLADHPDILINDLAATVNESNVFDDWRNARDVHFYRDQEKATLGRAVAGAVTRALEQRQKESSR